MCTSQTRWNLFMLTWWFGDFQILPKESAEQVFRCQRYELVLGILLVGLQMFAELLDCHTMALHIPASPTWAVAGGIFGGFNEGFCFHKLYGEHIPTSSWISQNRNHQPESVLDFRRFICSWSINMVRYKDFSHFASRFLICWCGDNRVSEKTTRQPMYRKSIELLTATGSQQALWVMGRRPSAACTRGGGFHHSFKTLKLHFFRFWAEKVAAEMDTNMDETASCVPMIHRVEVMIPSFFWSNFFFLTQNITWFLNEGKNFPLQVPNRLRYLGPPLLPGIPGDGVVTVFFNC